MSQRIADNGRVSEASPADLSTARFAGASSILVAILAAASGALFLAAADYDLFLITSEPARLLATAQGDPSLLRWAALTDLLAYLSLLPLIAYLRRRFWSPSAAMADLYSLGGAVYVIVGASGAALLAAGAPPLIEGTSAAAPDAATGALMFEVLVEAVFFGAWQTLAAAGAALWSLGVGVRIFKATKPLGVIAIALGVTAALTSLGRILDYDPLAEAALIPTIALGALVPLFLGRTLLFEKDLGDPKLPRRRSRERRS